MIDPSSAMNQELKTRAGPSTGHSQLVEGLSKLLKAGPGGLAFNQTLEDSEDSSGEFLGEATLHYGTKPVHFETSYHSLSHERGSERCE